MRDRRRFDWLHQVDAGLNTKEIARRARCSVQLVQINLATAKAAESVRLIPPPSLVLFFPLNGLFPHSTCRHAVVPIPEGSVMCCAVCARSGVENHPALERFPLTDPKPDPPLPRKPDHATRREKRARIRNRSGRIAAVSAA
jgi:hypothetical protein